MHYGWQQWSVSNASLLMTIPPPRPPFVLPSHLRPFASCPAFRGPLRHFSLQYTHSHHYSPAHCCYRRGAWRILSCVGVGGWCVRPALLSSWGAPLHSSLTQHERNSTNTQCCFFFFSQHSRPSARAVEGSGRAGQTQSPQAYLASWHPFDQARWSRLSQMQAQQSPRCTRIASQAVQGLPTLSCTDKQGWRDRERK